ncbi:MAG: GNAT family N-acetyltransferase [Bacteroidetes bacterium RBG_13_46_8]|nr:MAG: GNAT family N-acetyltransferase [Bacteroidetes bacterium RBG_13_46_8]
MDQNSKLIIRPVEEKDNLSLAKMIRQVFGEHDAPEKGTVYSDPTTDNLYLLFRAPRSVLWVAEINNEPIGCCGIYPTKGLPATCAELVKFYISKDNRGKGTGKELMKRCIQSAKEFGYNLLYLESLPHFAKAVRMYEKQGFIGLDEPLGKSEHTACNIWMIKEL